MSDLVRGTGVFRYSAPAARRSPTDAPAESKVRRYAEFWYGAKTWKTERRVIARLEASSQGVDSRFIVTNLAGLPKSLYEKIYCARGQAENPGLRRGRL